MKKDRRNIYKHNEQNNLIYSKVYVTEGYYSELLFPNETYVECYQDNNGRVHREDGSAYISIVNGVINYEAYRIHGLEHNILGPALIWYKLGKIVCEKYYLNGIEYTNKDITDNWIDYCKNISKLEIYK